MLNDKKKKRDYILLIVVDDKSNLFLGFFSLFLFVLFLDGDVEVVGFSRW